MTENTQPKQYGRPDNERIIPFMKIAKPAAIIPILLTIQKFVLDQHVPKNHANYIF